MALVLMVLAGIVAVPFGLAQDALAPEAILLQVTFDAGDDGWAYQDDVFGTSQPNYASGSWQASGGYSGGGLKVSLGGVDGDDIEGMSGGWTYTLSLGAAETGVVLSYRYRLGQSATYEYDEYSQVLAEVNATRYGRGAKPYADQIGGDGVSSQGNADTFEPTTEWQIHKVYLGDLPAGPYALVLGGYSSKKTTADEETTLHIDDVLVTSGNGAPTTTGAQELANRVDQAQFKAFNVGVAQFGDRCRLSGCDPTDYYNAVAWVENELQAMGYAPVRHDWSHDGQTGTNVYATKMGSVTPTEMYMIGAHLDGRGGGEAYDDDGSGVALLLEAARVFAGADVETERSVRFLFWDMEEAGLYGSEAYVNDRRGLQGSTDEPTWLGLIQHDMILYDHGVGSPDADQSPYADMDVEWRAGSGAEADSKDLAILWRYRSGTYAADYPANAYNWSTNTDDTPFHPYVASVSVRENRRSLTSGGNAEWINPNYHTTNDVESSYDNLDTQLGYNIVQTTVGTVAELAGASVAPSNNPPTADPQSVTTPEDTAVDIVLTGSDPDSDPLTFHIATYPTNGTLTGSPPNVNYDPDPDYDGPDAFSFYVNDGTVDSGPATVSITVTPVNDPPTADPQSVSTPEDVPLDILLTGSDPEGAPLTFHTDTGPGHGTLAGTPPNVTYTPDSAYVGADAFTFYVNDGQDDSNTATVDIDVYGVNHPPVADSQTVSTPQDTPVGITLTASDADGDPLTYHLDSVPGHGTLSGTPPNLTYTPNTSFTGSDSFDFHASDGYVDSNVATIDIDVFPLGSWVVFEDDFETDKGWTVNAGGKDTATRGAWERAVPQDTDYNGPKQLGTPVSGVYDLVTGPLAGSNASTHDIDGGVTSVRSPDIALPAGKDITLSFSYYLAHARNSSRHDYLRVRVVGGGSVATVLAERGAAENDDAAWSSTSIPISDFAGATVFLVIDAADVGGGRATSELEVETDDKPAGMPEAARASLVEAAIDDVVISASDATGPILEASFDTDVEIFAYDDDTFRGTSQPDYADGSYAPDGGHDGGALRVDIGGINTWIIREMSGGWVAGFTLNQPEDVALSFWFNLTQSPDYDTDEYSQALVSVNGVLYGLGGNDYVAQIWGNGNGGIPETTGWQQFSADVGVLPAGDHTLIIGGYNNKKSYTNEYTEVLIDDVLVFAK